MLKNIVDKLILEEISFRIIIIYQDIIECGGYGANLNIKNNENDLHYALRMAEIKNISVMS